MELEEMVKKLHRNKESHALMDHEKEFIEQMYTKLIYSGRPAEGTETKTIKKLYQLFLKRSLK